MKKIVSLALAALFICLAFASCGSSSVPSGMSKNEGSYPTPADNGRKDGSDYSYEEKPPVEDSSAVVDPNRKIIKTFRLDMETLEYDKATAAIHAEIAALGGYIAESSQSGGEKGGVQTVRYATYTVRIPSDKAEAFVSRISGEGNVLHSTLSTEDITDSYFDYKARLDSLAAQEKRLLDMLEKVDKMDLNYMLQIEDKLTSVRSEMNAIYSRLQRMDKSVDYSFIYLTVHEVEKYQPAKKQTFFSKLGNAFGDGLSFFGDFFSGIAIAITWLLPFLILGGVIVVVILIALRGKKKKETPPQKKDE